MSNNTRVSTSRTLNASRIRDSSQRSAKVPMLILDDFGTMRIGGSVLALLCGLGLETQLATRPFFLGVCEWHSPKAGSKGASYG